MYIHLSLYTNTHPHINLHTYIYIYITLSHDTQNSHDLQLKVSRFCDHQVNQFL